MNGKVIGKGPKDCATMKWYGQPLACCGMSQSIVVEFNFERSMTEDGEFYHPRFERAYLPFNEEGLILLELFKVAFRRRLMFGIGTRLATRRFAPTFNIHIKTKLDGGTTKHGYPDPDYFRNCLGELEANHISVLDLPKSWHRWFPFTTVGKPLWEAAEKCFVGKPLWEAANQ